MSARTAFHPPPRHTRRQARRGLAAHTHRSRDASRDRPIPRQRDEPPDGPRISFEVLLALAVVVACMCGALAVGAAFNLQF